MTDPQILLFVTYTFDVITQKPKQRVVWTLEDAESGGKQRWRGLQCSTDETTAIDAFTHTGSIHCSCCDCWRCRHCHCHCNSGGRRSFVPPQTAFAIAQTFGAIEFTTAAAARSLTASVHPRIEARAADRNRHCEWIATTHSCRGRCERERIW